MNEQVKMAVLDADIAFVTGISNYINRKENIRLEAIPFTDPAALEQYLGRHPVRILLASQETASDVEHLLRRIPLCLLLGKDRVTDPPAKEETAGRWKAVIYRYQPADLLIRQILHFVGAAGEYENDTGILLGVYSPLGRCGKTSLALALGFALAEKKRTLYLNLENYHGFSELGITAPAGQDISDLLYYFRTSPDTLSDRLQTMIRRRRELEMILPSSMPCDLENVSAGEWLALFSRIAQDGDYAVIVLDIGSLPEDLFRLLSGCRRVYVPTLEDPVSQAKLRQFMKNAQTLGVGTLQENLRLLQVPQISFPGAGSFPDALAMGEIAAYAGKVLAQDPV